MLETQLHSGKTQVFLTSKAQLGGHTVTDVRIARLQRRFGMTKVQARDYADLFFGGRSDV